jgi:hypothetical protein
LFTNNSATQEWGGAINNQGTGSPVISGSVFRGNFGHQGGSAILNGGQGTVAIRNCVFTANRSDVEAGAIENHTGSPTIVDCSFYGNISARGGAIANYNNANSTITNCVARGNTAPEILNSDSTSRAFVTYSNIQGGFPGIGNIDADPKFANAAAGDLHILSGSPSIDAANGNAAPATDMEGKPRVDDPATPNTGFGAKRYVDMGAYEYQP